MSDTINALQSNILLIFDEIENISPDTAASAHWRNGLDPVYFWQVIRSFAQTNKKWSLSICFVGTSPYLLEQTKINGVDNPAYLLAQKRFIPNLTFDETREMVDRLAFFMGLDFEPAAISKLQASYGGHPFFTRQVCSKVHQLTSGQRPKSVPLRRVEEAQGQFSGQLESYLFEIVSNLKNYYPEEFRLLKSLLSESSEEIREYASGAPDLIDHLVGYGLVSIRDGEPELAFEAVRRAVLQIDPDERLISLEGMWAELAIRRGRIEQNLRSNLRVWAKSIPKVDFLSLLDKQLSKKRLEGLSSTDASFLFSNDTSPLYLTDLIALLGHQKVLPYLEERRSLIRSALDSVNKFRADAHAKNITKEEFNLATKNFECVEDEFAL